MSAERYYRILDAIGFDHADGFSREAHAKLVYAVVENTDCRIAWQSVKNEAASLRPGLPPRKRTTSGSAPARAQDGTKTKSRTGGSLTPSSTARSDHKGV